MTAVGLEALFLDLSLHRENLQHDAKRLFAIIRPSWIWDHVQSKALSGGYLNTMVAFHLDSDDDKSDAIVLRMPGEISDTFNVYNRETEFIGIQLGIASKCFQPLVAVFNNGIAYQYTQGRTLTRNDIDDLDIIRKVTSKLVALHHVDTNVLQLKNTEGKPTTFDVGMRIWSRLEHAVRQIPEEVADPAKNKIYQENRIPKQKIREEIQTMKSFLGELNLATCPGHGDVHVKNMIFNEKTGDLFLLDYDMFGLYYEEYDIAFLFAAGPMLRLLGMYEKEDPDISPDLREQWIRSYIEAKYEYEGLKNDCIPDHVYDITDIKCSIIETLVSLVQLVMCNLGMASDQLVPGDIIQSVCEIKSRYFTAKEQLDTLKQRLLQLERMG